MFRNTLKKIFTVLLTWVLKKSTLSNSSHALRQGNTNKTPLMERQKIERTEEVKGSEKSWGQSSSEVRAEERLKEAMTQHLRLRFLPWPERESWITHLPIGQSPAWYLHVTATSAWGLVEGKRWKSTVSVMGKMAGGEPGTPSQKASTRSSLKLLLPLHARWHGA